MFAAEAICDTEEKRAFLERQIDLPKFLGEILNQLRKEEKARIFLNKVTKKEAPDYYDVIKKPMDLGTMGKKLCAYRSVEEFKADLDLIWDNCLKYNTAVYFIDCATEMRNIADSLLKKRVRAFPSSVEPIVLEGMPVKNNGRSELKKWIAKTLLEAKFESCEKKTLDILTDVLEYKIMKELKTLVKDKENSK